MNWLVGFLGRDIQVNRGYKSCIHWARIVWTVKIIVEIVSSMVVGVWVPPSRTHLDYLDGVMRSRPTAVWVEGGAELLVWSIRSEGKHPGGAVSAQLLDEILAVRLHRLYFRYH